MPRNRQKRKLSGKSTPMQPAAAVPSPAATMLMNRLATGGPEYLRENAERILIDSAELADEPEFADLSFNRQRAIEVTERWIPKYQNRLEDAQRKSQDEMQEVYDDMRIEIIDELLTPAFRKQVKERVKAAYNRYLAADDLKKLEIVAVLGPLLSMSDFPWGICGLIIEIYDRAVEPVIREAKEEQEFIDEMAKAAKEELKVDERELIDMLKNPEPSEKLEQLGQKLMAANPGLRERVEERAWKIIDAFEDELFQGKIDLKLFTEIELNLPLQRLQEERGEDSTEVEPSEDYAKQIFQSVQSTLNEIMTPERYLQLRKTVESTAQNWMRQRNQWAQALQFELAYLDEEKYEETKFFLAAFFGQLRRASKEQRLGQKTKKRRR